MRISDDLEEMRLLPIHVEAAVFGSGNVPIANINEITEFAGNADGR